MRDDRVNSSKNSYGGDRDRERYERERERLQSSDIYAEAKARYLQEQEARRRRRQSLNPSKSGAKSLRQTILARRSFEKQRELEPELPEVLPEPEALEPQLIEYDSLPRRERVSRVDARRTSHAPSPELLDSEYPVETIAADEPSPAFEAKKKQAMAMRRALNQETAEELERIRKRQIHFQAGGLALFVLAAMFLTVVLMKIFVQRSQSQPNLIIVQNGTLSDYFDTYGLVSRDETVITADSQGNFQPDVSEGTRLGIDDVVGRILGEESGDELLSKIRNINRQLSQEIVSLLSTENFPEAIRYYADADAEIYPAVRLMQRGALNNEVAALTENQNSIRKVMSERNRKLESLSLNDVVVNDLRSQKQALLDELNQQSRAVSTKQSGLVSFRINDKQNLVPKPRDLETMSVDSIRSLMNELRSTYRSVGEVKENDPIFRLATGGTQYFLLQVDGARSADFPLENSLKLEIRGESRPRRADLVFDPKFCRALAWSKCY
ncbi:MAG: HlyD family efflux transporter periplasmic adaptor subunit [Eubacteriales bacterium]|nr:HlyD family efflux transporter periplasmic adaptor subunit [Eubacteriales bacterium]